MTDEDRAFGYGMFYFFISFALGMVCLLLGAFSRTLLFFGVLLLVTSPIITAMLILLPEFFPETEKKRRQTSRRVTVEKHAIVEKPSRKMYIGIVGVTLLFLGVLYWMVQQQFVRTNEAIVIAVFSIVFQVILYTVTEVAKRR